MPASFLIHCIPTSDAPIAHVQGPNIQAMFLRRMEVADSALMPYLHDTPGYRPFTLSPLGIYGEKGNFQGFWLSRESLIPEGRACYIRVTVLDDTLISIVRQGIFHADSQTCMLGETTFILSDNPDTGETGRGWSITRSYPELMNHGLRYQRRKQLYFQFLSPTSFRQGKLDLPVPVPRLVFQSYKARFEKFYQVEFLPDFEHQVEQYVGIATMRHVNSTIMHTKQVRSIGFTGDVVFTIHPKAPPELAFQVNLLADYALFCGTGKKTVLGMGQTLVNELCHCGEQIF